MKLAIGLTFPGELQDESVICYLSKNFNINLNIIEASFSMSSGWAILEIEGSEEEIEKAFQYIESRKIRVQKIKQG